VQIKSSACRSAKFSRVDLWISKSSIILDQNLHTTTTLNAKKTAWLSVFFLFHFGLLFASYFQSNLFILYTTRSK
jgi:hypothetical protein